MRSKLKWTLTLFLAFLVQLSFAQEKTLTGVVSEGGLPLPGVSVVIKGTQNGTQTDLDGKYALKAKQGEVLVFSFIGLKDATKTVAASNVLNVSMTADDAMLEEVIVTAYGQLKTKNELTGNVVTVKGDVISNTPTVSPDQALQGRVAGLQMSASSGAPGAVQNIRIRGRNSMNASNEPLIVIDGVPMVNGDLSGSKNAAGESTITTLSALSSINSSDIESITVLKDAGSTAVYGARGSNGVILITTKRGKAGATRFEVKTSMGFQNNAVKGPKMLSGAQKKELFLESLYNSYGESEGFSKDQAYDFLVNEYGTDGIDVVNWTKNGSVDNDWGELIRRKNAPISTINVSASGGDEKSTFYASLGHNKTEGTVIGTDFRRLNGSLSLSKKLTDKVEFSNNISVANTKQNGNMENSAYFSNPNLTKLFMSPWVSPYNADGSYNLPVGGLHNSLYTINKNILQNDVTRAITNTSLSYNFTNNLKYTSSVAIDYTMANFHGYRNPIHGDGAGVGGYVSDNKTTNFNYVFQNGIDYRFYLGDSHRFDAKFVYEFQKNKNRQMTGYGEGIADGFNSLGTSAANKDASAAYYDWMQLGLLGILNYNFENRYLIDLTGRREGSSRFSDDRQWGNFYSVGAAWNLHEEAFMKNQSIVSTARFRGSYGTTGNSNIDPNKYQQLLEAVTYDQEGGLIPTQLGSVIGWEKQKKSDFGLDFGFLNNRITGSVAVYKSVTSDLLYNLPLSRMSGFRNQLYNLGALENKGYELELNLDIVRSEDFNWSIGGNYGTVENKLTKMPLDSQGNVMQVIGGYSANKEGHALGEWYLADYAGVNSQTGEAQWIGADGKLTSNFNEAPKRFQEASPLPKYTGGVNTHLDFKGFFLDAMVSFAGGHKVYEDWALQTNGNSYTTLYVYNGVESLMDRWQKAGDITSVPKLEDTQSAANSQATSPSTRFLYDGDYVRLRDLTFGYNFTSEAVRALKIDGLSLSVTGMNLVTWVKDSRLKYDPEIDPTGYTSLNSPPVKSVVFSINVKF